MTIEIQEVDVERDGPQTASVLALVNDLQAERDPAIDPFTLEGLRADQRDNERFERRMLVAFDGDVAVGQGQLWIHHMGTNDDKVECDLGVHPDHRRRGVGTALVRAMAAETVAIGRSILVFFVPDGEPAAGFFARFGLDRRFLERESRLWLDDTDPDTMRAWADARRERAADYRLVHWRGATPAAHVEHMATLMTAMNDAPLDDLDWDDDHWTPEMIHDFDDYFASRGFDRWTSIVLAPDGSPAGLTNVGLDRNRPRFAHQGDTVVIADHRNRGIGRWLKADMWLRLREAAPEVVAIDTGNAESNDPMLAINVAMGFAPLVAWGAWQAEATALLAPEPTTG